MDFEDNFDLLSSQIDRATVLEKVVVYPKDEKKVFSQYLLSSSVYDKNCYVVN